MAARCDRFNWFYALMFAAYGAQGERNTAAAAIYLHMALDAALQAGDRGLEIKATAILALARPGRQRHRTGAAADRRARRTWPRTRPIRRSRPTSPRSGRRAGQPRTVRGQPRRLPRGHRHLARRGPAAPRGAVRADAERAEDCAWISPAEALAALERAGPFLATHNEPGLDRKRLHDQTIALLALGRIAEAKAKLREVLARYDRETGPNARIGVLRDLGPALARAGDRAGALELYTREQQLLQAKSDSRYDRDMQDVQKLIKAENDRLQARRAAEVGRRGRRLHRCWRWRRLHRAPPERRATASWRAATTRCCMQVEHDPLTGLANRAHLQARVGAHGGDLFEGALFLIDVDHFKDINDRHGHAAGDSVLVAIARRLEGVLRERDLVVRWGGEEFLVMVDTMPVAEAVALAQRLMKAFVDSPGGRRRPGDPDLRLDRLRRVPAGRARRRATASTRRSRWWTPRCTTPRTRAAAAPPASCRWIRHCRWSSSTLPATLAQAAADGRAILEVHRPAETLSPA